MTTTDIAQFLDENSCISSVFQMNYQGNMFHFKYVSVQINVKRVV